MHDAMTCNIVAILFKLIFDEILTANNYESKYFRK